MPYLCLNLSEERALFGLGYAALACQSDDLGPALNEPVVGERLGRALLTLAERIEAVSQLAGDLSRGMIHDMTPAHGLDAVSQIAIDDDWSAMRFKRIK